MQAATRVLRISVVLSGNVRRGGLATGAASSLLRLPEHISNSKDSGTKKSATVGAGSMRPIIPVATE